MDLIYPKIDHFIQLIKTKGNGCLLIKIDLRKAFRQINICLGDYNLVSFIWKNTYFVIQYYLWGLDPLPTVVKE